MKKCTDCKLLRPKVEFSKNRTRPDGLQSTCKPCGQKRWSEYYQKNKTEVLAVAAVYRANNQDKTKAAAAKWRAEQPAEYSRELHLMREYGITGAIYDRMLLEQGGVCAICGTSDPGRSKGKPKSWCVDHNHETGQVRGLLCGPCNRALGMLKEKSSTVLRAYQYLLKFEMREPNQE
jgi:Recombination endonuclease VII